MTTTQRFVGGVAESNAPVAPGEVPESRLVASDELFSRASRRSLTSALTLKVCVRGCL